MLAKDDTTFNVIREKSLQQWLNEMSSHEDVAVRGGVTLAREYVEYLELKIQKLEQKNKLKDEYLKRMKDKNKSV